MTDQAIPDVTDEERRIARDWAAHIIRTPRTSLPMEAAAARVILNDIPAPAPPNTLTVGSKWDDAAALRVLPVHRTEAGYPNCSTCDGGGCPDCTDPA